jgi:uncharacterized protein YqjF (DUF2071 family)
MERISTREQMMKQTQRFLTAEWRDLAMVNFEIDPQLLRQRVPPGTELDTWNGRTFISIVGFRFLRTQVLGMTIPWHRNFEEVKKSLESDYPRPQAGAFRPIHGYATAISC